MSDMQEVNDDLMKGFQYMNRAFGNCDDESLSELQGLYDDMASLTTFTSEELYSDPEK